MKNTQRIYLAIGDETAKMRNMFDRYTNESIGAEHPVTGRYSAKEAFM